MHALRDHIPPSDLVNFRIKFSNLLSSGILIQISRDGSDHDASVKLGSFHLKFVLDELVLLLHPLHAEMGGQKMLPHATEAIGSGSRIPDY